MKAIFECVKVIQPTSVAEMEVHFNNLCGKIVDSSGNDNHGRSSRWIKRGVEGLFDTKAVKFKGAPVLVKKTSSLNSIDEQLTVVPQLPGTIFLEKMWDVP